MVPTGGRVLVVSGEKVAHYRVRAPALIWEGPAGETAHLGVCGHGWEVLTVAPTVLSAG